MKQILSAILCIISVACQAQSLMHKSLNCEILIDIDYKGPVNLYDSTGLIIKELKNNSKVDDCIGLTIVGKNDSMYCVIAHYLLKNEIIAKGWIKMDNPHLSIYSRNCGSMPILNLYQKAEKNSKIQDVIKVHTDYLHIKDCENNWLLVSVVISNKKYEGWISPDMQCSNPYTTCCGQ